ncbi:hypothetical protein OZ401_002120 [Candidatus Chlorohelix allophototropha]|uniref:Uncharacterized protein n=2 Tax=Candidatus Chlorohelix allophototropha TaxID=3003348 RepID=A0ABY9AZK8_9CHLR|nr:hypothetical protein OZ401_002120 [Chloroflexota bacterium L227-S17]
MVKQTSDKVASQQVDTLVEHEVETTLEGKLTPEMVEQFQKEVFAWKKAYFKRHPIKGALIAAFVTLRIFYGLFFLYAFYQKFSKRWMTTDTMQKHFRQRYEELEPNSFSARYLKFFGLPFYKPIAWVLVPSQLIIALNMVSGTATRKTGVLSLFILLNIAAGGYGNPTLPPFIVNAIFLSVLPSGQWLGFDRKLHERYPNNSLFV